MTASQTGSEGQSLSSEEADRAALSIRPVWEVDDEDDAAQAVASDSPVTPEPPRDTVIDGMPMVTLGRPSEAGAESAAKTTRSSGEPRKLEAPPPPKNAGPTRIGLGNEDGTDDGWGPENRPSDRPPAAPPPPPRRESRSPSGPSGGASEAPARPRNSAGSPVMPQPVSFSKADDPVELPVEKRSGMLYVVGGIALLGIIIGAVFLSSGGDEKPSTPAETAKPATTEAPKPTIADPPPLPAETAATTAAAETAAPTATAEATAPPVETAAPTATATAVAAPEKPKPANTGTKPSGTKPGGSGTKPGGSKPGGGGIIRETPF